MELVNILYRVDTFYIFTFAFVYKAGLYDRKPVKALSFPLSLSHYQGIDDDEVVKGGAGIWLVLPEAGDDSNFGCSPLGEGRLCEHPCISPFLYLGFQNFRISIFMHFCISVFLCF